MNYIPNYLKLHREGRLKKLSGILWEMLCCCCLCPRDCKVNRLKGQKGFCGADSNLKVAGYMKHTGEEPPISGTSGSGTIFFSNCSLRCLYCQNYSFSQQGEGQIWSVEKLADAMLELQGMGVHNINFVTPEHYLPHIISALDIAAERGLVIPLVYNSSGYVSMDILKLLDGVVDVYLCDMKYGDNNWAEKLSFAPDYCQINQEAVKEMYRQVSDCIFDKEGIIMRGLIIRHLVLPEDASGSFAVMNWIRENLGKDVFISLMSQYYPFYKAKKLPSISRRISLSEYESVKRWMLMLGLEKGWWQQDYGLEQLSGENIRKEFKK